MSLHIFCDNDLIEYQSFVNTSENASPYHNCAWGQAVKDAYGFDMYYFGLRSEQQLVAVMPAVLMRSLKGKRVLCSLPYCDMGGVLATDEQSAERLLALVVEHASENNYQFEYRATLAQQEELDVPDGAKVRMLFSLLSSAEEQLASFKPKLRSQIKKASKNGVTSRVIKTPTAHEIDQFYSVFAVNMRDLGSPVHAKGWFTEIFKHYENNAFLVLVDVEDKCVGGGIVIHNQTRAVIPWASTLRDYNKLAPNMLLYWEVLSEVINRGINQFDFGRSGFNEGTYRFKKQWGAEPVLLQWQSLNNGKLAVEEQSTKSNMRAKVEKTWQSLPLSMTTFVGPKLRKYISL